MSAGFSRTFFRVCVSLLVTAFVYAQQNPAAGPRKPGGGGGPNIPPLEESGFQELFDGKSLTGWDGDSAFWRVENGIIIGECTAEKQPAQNTFLIWRGGSPADFELKLDYRLIGNNSGVQIRSIELPDVKWAMKGYQADMDAAQRYTGQFYEERGRGFLALRGQFNYVAADGTKGNVALLGDNEALKSLIKNDDWNSVHLIARGNTMIQLINGHVMSMLIDDDTAGRKMDGLIGFQIHRGPAMKIELRNIRLKKL